MNHRSLRAIVTAVAALILLAGISEGARRPRAWGAGPASELGPYGPAAQGLNPGPSQRPTLQDFAWLEGNWEGAWGPRVAQQMWLAPKAGDMPGMLQLVEGDRTLVIELFTIVEKPEGLELHIRHFTPSLRPWEQAESPTLALSTMDAKAAVFQNPNGGEPKRVVFSRVNADTLIVRSEIPGTGDENQVTEITYSRKKSSSGENAARR